MKHRETIFCVVRLHIQILYNEPIRTDPVICASCRTLERAEELAGVYSQQMKDAGIEEFEFEVQTTTFYDE